MLRLLNLLFSVIVALLMEVARAGTPFAQTDLRLFPFGTSNYEFTEDWDFYPAELLTPAEIQAREPPRKLSLIAIIPKDHKFGELRHGTFRMQVRLPEPAWRYTIFFPELRSASRIWINGEQISNPGRVGTSIADEKPALRPVTHVLQGEARELDIVIQISGYSNYQFLSSSTAITIGYTSQITMKHAAAKIRDAFVVGAIFIMAFYHFSLFALRRERIDPFLFGMFCLWIGIRTICRSEGLLLYEIFDQPDFHWQYRFEYWGISVPSLTCCNFIYVLFHRSISRRVVNFVIVASLIYTVIVGVLPLYQHGVLLIPFEICILLVSSYLVKCLACAKPEQRDGAILIAFGFGIFILTIGNDILKNHNLMRTTTLSHMGLFLFILFQAILISKRFSRAFHRIKDAEFEIRRLNDDLEKKVKDRTQTIRIILDNVKAGFLLVGPDLAVREGFTKSCQDLIGRPITVGQKLHDLLEFNDRERPHFQMAVSQVFSGLLPDEVSLSQIHSRITLDQRVLSLQGSIVRDEDASVHAILFTITEVTELVKAERDARINQTLLSILQDKFAFQTFITDSMRELKLASEALKQGDENRLRMVLHTLKGNFATYGLDDVARYIHTTEDLENIGPAELEEIASRIHQFMSSYQDLIGLDPSMDGSQGVLVPFQAFHNMHKILEIMRAPSEIQRVFDVWVQEVKLVPIRSLFGAMLTHTSRLAARLGKEVDIHVNGGDVLVNPEKLTSVISNLSHMLRNAIDHGIEFPEKRAPKNPRARIELAIRRHAGELLVTIQDDGAGLDLDRIRDVAIEKNLVTPEAFDSLSEQQKAHLIFLPGFSTAESVSEVSGRGVGMASLLDAVKQLGGHIEVESRKGHGCEFRVRIPDEISDRVINKVA
ncbi:7TM diverse intracellular signaling domain-containing protein [Oligoflexus tunisiensis]|uniref:7TM diverse intracellular signaling domain-containing protein n=1 Tax=Oligoflexus tunisiensis TaxID=708132 RepID=UPI000B2B6857|nr:7TM diverse intracellular signaling domain-containing protein [Oligoflexus tunisiensis]